MSHSPRSHLKGTHALPSFRKSCTSIALTVINPSHLNRPEIYFKSLAANAIAGVLIFRTDDSR